MALAPDLDPRFERLYGYLHDDVSRRRASIGLALELCGRSRPAGGERRRARAGRPAGRRRLLLVEDADRPFLTRSLRVPDRVTAHLLGDDTPDPLVDSAGRRRRPRSTTPAATSCLERSLAAGQRPRLRPGADRGAGLSSWRPPPLAPGRPGGRST